MKISSAFVQNIRPFTFSERLTEHYALGVGALFCAFP